MGFVKSIATKGRVLMTARGTVWNVDGDEDGDGYGYDPNVS